MSWGLLKKALFQLDAERAHHLGCLGIQALGRVTSGQGPVDPHRVFGVTFRNRVGLAAGFDKDGELISALPAFGFGFAELGTVTPQAQPGNPKPRMFRDPATQSLFNRMGFNNLGAEHLVRKVEEARARGLPENFRLGINIGKNKDTPNEKARDDYRKCAERLGKYADYVVVNVSSPNTPGLRDLQSEESLKGILGEVRSVTDRPVLLKLAPEVRSQTLKDVISALELAQLVDGWVLTNTWAGTWNVANESLPGGFSGGKVMQASRESLFTATQATKKPLISVGGIGSISEARTRIEAGAALIQVYTGWIYQGPWFPKELAQALVTPRP